MVEIVEMVIVAEQDVIDGPEFLGPRSVTGPDL